MGDAFEDISTCLKWALCKYAFKPTEKGYCAWCSPRMKEGPRNGRYAASRTYARARGQSKLVVFTVDVWQNDIMNSLSCSYIFSCIFIRNALPSQVNPQNNSVLKHYSRMDLTITAPVYRYAVSKHCYRLRYYISLTVRKSNQYEDNWINLQDAKTIVKATRKFWNYRQWTSYRIILSPPFCSCSLSGLENSRLHDR